MAGITLKKGLEPFEIYFEDADVTETIYFNPSDSNLPKRLIECRALIEEKSKKIKPYEKNGDGTPADADGALEYLNKTNSVVYDALDYAFGNKVSDTIFKHCGPFSVVDGGYYILNFLDAVAPELEKLIKAHQKSANTKAEKYLKKYGR